MIRATQVVGAMAWPGPPADTVVLDLDDRHRRRIVLTGVRGVSFLLDLPETVTLRTGDGIILEDGRCIEVLAAPEALIEIRAADNRALVRLAWHLGNRHLPTQVINGALRIRRDPVIETMLEGLGARLRAVEAPFDPEGGAYATAPGHAHHGSGTGSHAH